jgi:hypothetical protein
MVGFLNGILTTRFHVSSHAVSDDVFLFPSCSTGDMSRLLEALLKRVREVNRVFVLTVIRDLVVRKLCRLYLALTYRR